MRRDDICLYFGPAERAELQALITNRNTARMLVWRAEIVLATTDGHGTFEIMRRALGSVPRLVSQTTLSSAFLMVCLVHFLPVDVRRPILFASSATD